LIRESTTLAEQEKPISVMRGGVLSELAGFTTFDGSKRSVPAA